MGTSHPRGTTLVEIMVAVLILSIGLVMILTTFTTALRAQSLGVNTLLAMNMAREGLEGVRNIRDTNWLVNSGNRRECWNYSRVSLGGTTDGMPYIDNVTTNDFVADKKITAAKCDLYVSGDLNSDTNRNPIRAGYYTLVQDLRHTMGWHLEGWRELNSVQFELGKGIFITDYAALTSEIEDNTDLLHPYLLYQVRPDTGNQDFAYVYTPLSREFRADPNAYGYTLTTSRPKFFRQIRVRYLCNEPVEEMGTITEKMPTYSSAEYPVVSEQNCDSHDNTRHDNRMEVTSIVQWFENGRVHEVRLMMHLSDWLGRTEYLL